MHLEIEEILEHLPLEQTIDDPLAPKDIFFFNLKNNVKLDEFALQPKQSINKKKILKLHFIRINCKLTYMILKIS